MFIHWSRNRHCAVDYHIDVEAMSGAFHLTIARSFIATRSAPPESLEALVAQRAHVDAIDAPWDCVSDSPAAWLPESDREFITRPALGCRRTRDHCLSTRIIGQDKATIVNR